MNPQPSPDSPVLVTGAASGIGAACAAVIAASGRPVVLWDLDPAAVTEAGARLEAVASVPVLAAAVDVSKPELYAGALDAARSVVGPIGGFVHCAGVVDSTPMSRLSAEAWRRVLEVNLTAFGFLTAALIPDLTSQDGSSVVGIGSVNALVGQGAIPSYSASKAGVLGLVRSLAAELGPRGVRVNAVCPGYIATPMLSRSLEDTGRAERMAGLAMLKRVGRPRRSRASSGSFSAARPPSSPGARSWWMAA
ncbi:oxidoreductase [Sphaerimonospora thailandensis]|uniref:Oxidoreductase n=1 Tax=Sphaerimonospora thailandensis TaxID=795644 RepID=A0A8J3R5B0_9ACTN|nr:SDR family NAD(P)-dependent oxidoreductase [Sphaerimonospora thailandensis]GIH68106.1 oxidoreductase [Sphaerimonospora thailandensis]